MQIFPQWIEYTLRPKKAFTDHFEITHKFHGMHLHQISESYSIKPKSTVAIQLFYEGIRFPDVDLHLKCQIKINYQEIKVHFNIFNPNTSKHIIKEVKVLLLDQLQLFHKRFNLDPGYRYVRAFCNKCSKENTKPFNLCVRTCEFEVKPKN